MVDEVVNKTQPTDPWAAFRGQQTNADPWAAFRQKANTGDSALSMDNLVRSAAHGIPVLGGVMDKVAAGADAVTQPVLGRGAEGATVGERYEKNLANETAHSAAFDEAHPYASTGAEIAGGTAAMLPAEAAAPIAFGARGANLTTRALASGATNAGIGAADSGVRGKDPLIGAGVGAAGGVVAPIVGQVAGGIAGKLGGTGGPSTEALFNSGDQHYRTARALGVQFDPAALNTVGTRIGTFLTSRGLLPEDPAVAPVYNVLSRLQANGNPATRTLDELQSVYQGLGTMARGSDNPVTRLAAGHALNGIDDFYTNMPAGAVVQGNGPAAARELAAGASDWGAARRAERLELADDKGALNARTTGTGANKENAQRQQYKSLVFKRGTGFNDDETQAIRDVAGPNDPLGDILRYFGKFAPSGPVSAASTAGLSHFLGGNNMETALAAGGAYAAKKASELATSRRADLASELVRRRSDLGSQYAPGSIADMLDRLGTLGTARGAAVGGDAAFNTP